VRENQREYKTALLQQELPRDVRHADKQRSRQREGQCKLAQNRKEHLAESSGGEPPDLIFGEDCWKLKKGAARSVAIEANEPGMLIPLLQVLRELLSPTTPLRAS